ncbi:uncharacterized protein AC631_00379 [Debaryomyces fabryi]|uniref:Major facilitator superfamily (MFS) profile domain-containing protein n=1 Tax=Debaryomyces fabryi TaxID=58627 RepID=A0A0V1Q5Y3_9ASCO|nr:uncharacterized protein AC631_00379 [Debaryomyces fabryi]KSA03924.1 hypothetical protein AC631_00379 [Debaryomyces fabryi]CUM48843.1 unnamed protein product [Debaryomyces fabryi]
MVKRLGIVQPDRENVTGTISMMNSHEEELSKNDQSVADSGLKTTSNGIILFPQPHDNPNDPLNWPIWKRDLCLLVVGFQTFLGGGQSPLLAAGMHDLAVEFDRPITTISYLVGGFMLALGTGSVFASPTAILYGKRMVYLLGIFIFLMGSIWAGAAPDFGNLMGGRILTGFGASPTESLPSATIAEIYFAHERAYRVGIYTMLMLGGKNIVPLLSALVFQSLDRHWLFWILSMFLGMNLVLTYFLVPETFWDRSPIPNKRSLEETKAAQAASDYHPPSERPNAFAMRRQTTTDLFTTASLPSTVTASNAHPSDVPIGIETNEVPSNIEANQAEPTSYKEKLALFSGRHTIDSWWMVALRPFFLYLYPSILFGSLIYSLAVVWLIVISETITGIFQSEGYEYNQQTIGLFYISPFVGGILGSLSAGLISDRLSRYLIARNDGVYEPEFRLLMLIPSTFFTSLGLMGFGWSSYEKDKWVGPVILFGCLSFGSSMASTTAITFVVDSYKMFASEALVSLNFSKNLLGFIFSLFNNGFFDAKGGRTTFVVYGAVQIFVSLFGIPLYIYGKKVRSWTDDKEILKYLYHADNIPAGVNDNGDESLHRYSTQDGNKDDNESSPNTTN